MALYDAITQDQLANAFRASLPPGLPHGEGTVWGKLCDALAESWLKMYQRFSDVALELNPNTAKNTLSEWEGIFYHGDEGGAQNSPFYENEFNAFMGTDAERRALLRSIRTYNYGGADTIDGQSLEATSARLTEGALTKLLGNLIPGTPINFDNPTYTIETGFELGDNELGLTTLGERVVFVDYDRPRIGVGTRVTVSSELMIEFLARVRVLGVPMFFYNDTTNAFQRVGG